MGRVRRRAPAHSGRAARRGGSGPENAPRDNARTAAAHGGFRTVGISLRDGIVAGRNFLVGLLRQPRRGSRERDRGRSSRCRCPRGDGGADGVDGNGDGSSGCPCGGSRGARRQVEDLAPALGHCPVACVGQRPSFARSASRSTTSRKAGRAQGSFSSRRRGIPAARIMASHNRPHRP